MDYWNFDRGTKATVEDAERLLYDLGCKCPKLDFGLNVPFLHYTIKPGSTPLTVQVGIAVVRPKNQRDGEDFCFILDESLYITGRGAKKYRDDIVYELREKIDSIQYVSNAITPYTNTPKKVQLLSGFRKDTYEAVYTEVIHQAFLKDREVLVEPLFSEQCAVIESDSALRVIYRTEGDNDRSVIFFYKGGVFRTALREKVNEWRIDIVLAHNGTRVIDHSDSCYLLDDKGYAWVREAQYTVFDNVDADYGRIAFVKGECFYRSIKLNTRWVNHDDFFIYDGKLYECLPGVTVIDYGPDETYEALFRTDIPSETELKGFGTYKVVGSCRDVIVPLSDSYITSRLDYCLLCVVGSEIHVVIGPYPDVGFIVNMEWGRVKLSVGTVPKEKHISFYPSYNLIPKSFIDNYRESNPDHCIEFFDKRFESAGLPFEEGDMVEVVIEPTQESRLQGLKGKVLEISENKQFAKVNFFNYFETELEVFKLKYIPF